MNIEQNEIKSMVDASLYISENLNELLNLHSESKEKLKNLNLDIENNLKLFFDNFVEQILFEYVKLSHIIEDAHSNASVKYDNRELNKYIIPRYDEYGNENKNNLLIKIKRDHYTSFKYDCISIILGSAGRSMYEIRFYDELCEYSEYNRNSDNMIKIFDNYEIVVKELIEDIMSRYKVVSDSLNLKIENIINDIKSKESRNDLYIKYKTICCPNCGSKIHI